MRGLELNSCPLHGQGTYQGPEEKILEKKGTFTITETQHPWLCPVCGAKTYDGWEWEGLNIDPIFQSRLEYLFAEIRGEEVLDNPGKQIYASCGCSESVFRFRVGHPDFGAEFEIRYWHATHDGCEHNMRKPRIYLVVGKDNNGQEILKKVS